MDSPELCRKSIFKSLDGRVVTKQGGGGGGEGIGRPRDTLDQATGKPGVRLLAPWARQEDRDRDTVFQNNNNNNNK